MGIVSNAFLSLCVCVLSFNVLVKSSPLSQNEIDRGYLEMFKKQLPKSATAFLLDLLHKLSKERPGENMCTSPVGAFASLMMLHLGAGEKTRKELQLVLKITESDVDFEKLHENFAETLRKIEHIPSSPEDTMPETIITNGFFVQKDHPIHESFIRSLQKYYDANATNVDFLEHAGEATDLINSFIAGSTKQRIPKFYEAPVSSTAKAILASVLYFHGIWKNPFNKEHTEVGKFHADVGTSEIEVPMMRNQKVIACSHSDALQFDSIELPYQGDQHVFVAILPRPAQTLKNLTEHMYLMDIHEINRNTKVIGVDYKIPKMKFSWKNSLVNTLGLEEIFRNADLSQMTAEKLPISDLMQAAEIEIDEHGTTASAASAVSVTRLLTAPVTTEKQFYVDRPFLAYVIHRPTHMVLYQAAVYKPQQ